METMFFGSAIFLVILSFFAGRFYGFFRFMAIMREQNRAGYLISILSQCEKDNEMMGRWLDPYFHNNGYKKIVIYGVGGEYYENFRNHIRDEMFDEIFLMDSNVEKVQKSISEHIYCREDLKTLKYDVIVVTSVSHFMEIQDELLGVWGAKNIVSYTDIVFNAYKETES